ncbi:MAG: hypothetical protein GZ094_03125 [Mariniphaga sp.]|nr:hypothetical protein [Mariniphaga sp.]
MVSIQPKRQERASIFTRTRWFEKTIDNKYQVKLLVTADRESNKDFIVNQSERTYRRSTKRSWSSNLNNKKVVGGNTYL